MNEFCSLPMAISAGPEGTPYAYGCFFFDFYLHDYPNSPPKAKFLTTGGSTVRFNPNLYSCGKVCLSLLGTWSGPTWEPNKSTFLQVLISIQGLVMVEDPYFNEPGFEGYRQQHKKQAQAYNQNIRKQTLKWAIEDPLRNAMETLEVKDLTSVPSVRSDEYHKKSKSTTMPTSSIQGYPEFAIVVVMHFAQMAKEIEVQLQEWTKHDKSLKNQTIVIRDLLNRAKKHSQGVAAVDVGSLKPAARPTHKMNNEVRICQIKSTSNRDDSESSEVIEIL